jgi:hypothetical protein
MLRRIFGHKAMGEMRNACKMLVGKPRHRWEDNIKMDLKGTG